MTLSEIINPWGLAGIVAFLALVLLWIALDKNASLDDTKTRLSLYQADSDKNYAGRIAAEKANRELRTQLQSEQSAVKYLESLLADARAQIAKMDGDNNGRIGGSRKRAGNFEARPLAAKNETSARAIIAKGAA